MSIKRFIKLFVPPIFVKAYQRIKIRKDLQLSPLPQIEHHSEKIVVIGNGPSLNESIKKYKNEIISNDRIVVNFFASTEYYVELKPNIYLFADPAFFNTPEKLTKRVNGLADEIVKKTTWSIQMIAPLQGKDSPFVRRLLSNNHISVNYYYDRWQDIGEMSKFEAWDKNLIAPPAQTVLNVAIYLSLFWRYKETYLIGADSTFIEDLRVDQNTNELLSTDSHFYDSMDNKNLTPQKFHLAYEGWKLHDLIHAFGRMFEYYADLKEYADYKGLKVYNASEYSWINVFERKKLK